MKKYFLGLSVILMSLFIGIIGVNAAIQAPSDPASFVKNLDTGYMTGDLSLNVTTVVGDIDARTSISKGDKFAIYFKLNEGTTSFHIVDNKVILTAKDGWKIDGESSKTITIKEDGTVYVTVEYVGSTKLEAGVYAYAKAEYTKDDSGEACGFGTGTPAPNTMCEFNTGQDGKTYYFDKLGVCINCDNDLTEEQAAAVYYKDCFSCEIDKDGKYRDSNGVETDEAGYYKDCFSCKKTEDGKYHGLDGKETTEEQYKKECDKICYVDKENNKYYCKEGNECTKEEYDNQCTPNQNTGSFIPMAGIAAGITLIVVSTIMVKKQSKLRKI